MLMGECTNMIFHIGIVDLVPCLEVCRVKNEGRTSTDLGVGRVAGEVVNESLHHPAGVRLARMYTRR